MVTRRIIALLLLVSAHVFACDIPVGTNHTNPDGSQGGFVSASARVSPHAYVSPTARVCGSAWVDEHVMLSDFAVVDDEAWIMKYVEISGYAEVREHAVLSGLADSQKLIVTDNAKIRSNAKIRGSYHITGASHIYGSVEIKGRGSVGGYSTICESVVLEDVDLFDSSYYCADGAESAGKIAIANKHVGTLVDANKEIHFELQYVESLRPELTKVILNGEEIDQDYLIVQKDLIRILPHPLLQDGLNEIVVSAIDLHGKVIVDEGTSIIVGKQALEIELSSSLSASAVVEAWFRYKGDELKVPTRRNGASLILNAIPDIPEARIDIMVLDQNVQKYVSFELISPVTELSLDAWPSHIQNNLDFSSGLTGWNVSVPNNVELVSVPGGYQASLALSEELTLEHVFRLENSAQSTLTPVSFLRSDFVSLLPDVDMHVLMLAKKSREFKRVIFNPQAESHLIRGSVDGLQAREKVLNFFADHAGEDVVLRFYLPDQNAKFSDGVSVTVGRSSLQNASGFLTFKNLSLYTATQQSGYYDLLTPRGCGSLSENERGGLSGLDKTWVRESNSFSAGEAPHYISNYQNRMWGEFTLRMPVEKYLAGLHFELWQDGVLKASVPGSPCILNEVVRTLENGQAKLEFSSNPNNPFTHLVSFDANSLSYISTTPGSLVEIIAYGLTTEGEAIRLSLAPEMREVLSSLNAPAQDLFGARDDYRALNPGTVRTGGDTWGIPSVVDRLESLIALSKSDGPGHRMKVNDIAKMNGGIFPDHETHTNGLQADIRINDHRNLIGSSEIENGVIPFIGSIEAGITAFNDLLINWDNEKNNVLHYLNNRCLGGRYTAFNYSENGVPRIGRKGISLIKLTSTGHIDHMHMSFPRILLRNDDPQMPTLNKPIPPTGGATIHDFKFEYEDGKIKVSRKDDVSYLQDFNVLWRAQSSETYAGDAVDFGDDLSTSKNEKKIKRWWERPENQKNTIEKPYVEVVIADFENVDPEGSVYGGCVSTKFKIELADLCVRPDKTIVPWFYHKNPDGSLGGVVAVGSTIDSASTLSRSAKICGESVDVENSSITGNVIVQNSTGDPEKDDPKLQLKNFTVTVPASASWKKEDLFLNLDADGIMENVQISTPTEILGDVDLNSVTLESPVVSGKRIRLINQNNEGKMILNDLNIPEGHPFILGQLHLNSASEIKGDVEIIANGESVIHASNLVIDATASSLIRDKLVIDTGDASAMYFTNTTITGKPLIKESISFSGSVIEGDGSYIGSAPGPLDGLGNPFVSVLNDHMLKGLNDLKGNFIIKTALEESKIETLPHVVGSEHFQTVILEDGLYGESLVKVNIRGNVHVRGKIPNEINLDSQDFTMPGGSYLNSFVDNGSEIQGTKLTINGPIAVWHNARLIYSEGEGQVLNLARLASGLHFNIDGSILTNVNLSGSAQFNGAVMSKHSVSGANNLVANSTLTRVYISGTSCVQGRTWSDKSVANFACDGEEPLVKNSFESTWHGIKAQQEAVEREMKKFY